MLEEKLGLCVICSNSYSIISEHMGSKTAKVKRRVDDYSEVMRQERASHKTFKSFLPKPKNFSFELQDRDEEVILVLRQHPITQFKQLISFVLVTIFVPWLLKASGIPTIFPKSLIFALYWMIALVFLGMLLRTFLLWFFNVYIITDERIIDVDFLSMTYKNISAAKTENIEDVTSRSSGVFASIFDYGDIHIQTAGEETEFEFESVPHPAKVAKLINELILEEEREKIEGRVN